MKTCTVCKENKSLEAYYRSAQTKDGRQYRCKKCDDNARRKYQQRHYKRFRDKARDSSLKTKYGITQADYEEMLKQQNYCCAICKDHISKNKHHTGKVLMLRLSVDHDHVTGKVRGLLCNSCNRGLGFLKESKDVLQEAISYLSK